MCGGEDWGRAQGQEASHTPKAGLGSNSWAEQWRPREAPCRTGAAPAVHLHQVPGLRDSTAGTSASLGQRPSFCPSPKCLLSWAQWSHLGTHPTPHPQAGSGIKRGRRGWGQGWRHPGRPPGLTGKISEVGKNSSLSPPALPAGS